MHSENKVDIQLEAIEVLLNHILYVRGVYPSQIFKKRRIYNTPVFVSIFPPLNNYLAGVLRSVKELMGRNGLQSLEVILYHEENNPLESYQMLVESLVTGASENDPHLIEYEQQLRSAIYKLSERVKQLSKLPPGTTCFKIHLHTCQDAFVRLSHESQFQEFPWLQAQNFKSQKNSQTQNMSLLPLAAVENVGLKMQARIFKIYVKSS
ncbi:hypothetical protein KR074_002363 [Drosophila pseudoananassae]|nr:hypothetical protein KR074_002363 [Drosophila pseudoananassae]